MIEAKGFVLGKGPWYKTSGSPRLPFYLNQSLSFPNLFKLDGTCTALGRLCFDMLFFSKTFVGRHKQGLLVSWMEKADLGLIR